MRTSFLLLLLSILLLPTCKKDTITLIGRHQQMQLLAIDLAEQARAVNPNFMMVVQNAPGILFDATSLENPDINNRFLAEMDAFTAEALFYNNDLDVETSKLNQLDQLADSGKAIIVLDLIASNNIQPCHDSANAHGFISSPRDTGNIEYTIIPTNINQESANPIYALTDAKNCLYLINSEKFETRETYLSALRATNFDAIFMDLFDKNGEPYTLQEIAALKTKQNSAPRLVLAYLNVGAVENWRYYWGEYKHFCKETDLCQCKYGIRYKDEYWAKFWRPKWKEIMREYMDKILAAGFDGVVMDNMEAYEWQCD